jgi:predicted phage terminase large subunit-like protein
MKQENKKAIEEWEAYCKHLQNLTPAHQLTETSKEKEARIANLLSDYNAFVAYYFYAVTRGTPSAPFHLQAAKKIKQNKNFFAVFEWARGHAKSTHISLFIPLWLMAQGEVKNLMLISYSYDMACKLLSKIQAHLESNPRWIADFGEQVKLGSWTAGEFTTREGVNFSCRGAGQSPRGASSDDSYRPDYIIVDDIDDDELVENPKRVRKLVDWVLTALLGAMDMGRGRFIMVGNRIHKNSVLANIAKAEGVHHSIVNALTKKGLPAWEAKYSLEEIARVRTMQGFRRFEKEYMNNPIVEGTVFKEKDIIWVNAPKPSSMEDIVIYCDPSYKNTVTSDFKAIVMVGKQAGKLYVMRVFNRQTSILVLIKWLYDEYTRLPERERTLSNWYSEANFIQGDLIMDALFEEGLLRGYQLPMIADKRAKPDKFTRIESISPLFERGLICFDESIKNETDAELAIEHLLAFEKGTRTPDDFPDALEGAIFLLEKRGRTNHSAGKVRIGKDENNMAY